jgi:hypothetical protein
MMTFEQFAEQLAKSATQVRPELEIAAAKIGEIEKKIAVEKIGREDNGWPPLAESTIAEKERLGFTGKISGTDPLLRTGEMRASITFEVTPTPVGVDLVLGSADPVAKYQELGTATIPPRPFLATATIESIPDAEKILGQVAVDLLAKEGR